MQLLVYVLRSSRQVDCACKNRQLKDLTVHIKSSIKVKDDNLSLLSNQTGVDRIPPIII